MALVLDIDQKVFILRLKGTDMPKGRTVTETVSPLAKKTPFIIVDLDNERLTSMGFGTLVNISNTYKKIWGKKFLPINLYNINPQVESILDISGIKESFRVWNNLDDCYKSLGNDAAS